MKFSIVIPVYKTEHLLKRCLDSFAAQTDGDFEVIVVDDCSPGEAGRSVIAPCQAETHAGRSVIAPCQAETHAGRSGIAPCRAEANPAVAGRPPYQAVVGADHRAARTQAQEIVARYDARFKYVRHEKNLSLFQARQTGLRLAQGEYVIPFDSDDYALPKLLEELKRAVCSGDAAARRVGRREAGPLSTGDAAARRVGRGEASPLTTGDAAARRVGCRESNPLLTRRAAASPLVAQSNNQTIKQSPPLHLPLFSPPDLVVYQMMYDNGKKITKPSVRYKNEFLSGAEALDRFFASRIQCAICGKAVRREVYLKAMDQLAAPRDFYLNSSEDLCQTFPILLNAQSVATIAYPGYRYWLNDDSLTTTLTDPAKLGKAAENTARVFALLAGFVRRTLCAGPDGCGEKMRARLEGFMRPTLRWYLSNLRHLSEAEWRACVAELNRHFSPDLVAREAMLLVEESATYRLGKMLVSAVRIFRRAR